MNQPAINGPNCRLPYRRKPLTAGPFQPGSSVSHSDSTSDQRRPVGLRSAGTPLTDGLRPAFQTSVTAKTPLEATQDAFLKAFRLSGYRGDSRFSTWLYRIARTRPSITCKARRWQWRSMPGSPVRGGAQPLRSNGLEVTASGERAGMLRPALRMPCPTIARVLMLFYLQEQSLEEICEIMG
ncbi:MAG: hypothetical protein IPM81_11960 [Saprospirales bacterium]|nr:hypothetical protein [Saprospirales bacterium]